MCSTAWARLVLGPHALDLQLLCQLVEAAMEVGAELHQVLDVVHDREERLEQLEKGALGLWQRLAGHQLHQVAEVIAAVEGQPGDLQQRALRWAGCDVATGSPAQLHTSSFRMTPDVMRTSPKSCTSMPRFSFCMKSIPDCFSSSMLSWAYMSSDSLNSLPQRRP